MRKLVSCMAIIICLVLAIPLAGGCSEPEEENTFTRLLSLLPAEAKEGRVITLINYKLFWQANGIQIYDSDNLRIDREEYVYKLIDITNDGHFYGEDIFRFSSYWTSMGTYLDMSSIKDENIGYKVTDVDAEINNIFSLYSPDFMLFGADSFGGNEDMMLAAVGELSQQATEIVRRAIGDRKEEYVFLNPQTGKRWVSIHKAFDKAVMKLGLTTKEGKKIKTRVAKKSVAKKPSRVTAVDTILNIIKKSRQGVDKATLKKKTRLKDNNIRTILYRLKKQGKVKSAGRGIYVKA